MVKCVNRKTVLMFLLTCLLITLISLGEIFAQVGNGKGRPKNPARRSRQLSPEEKKKLKERYERFKQLSLEEQERLRRRQREFENLPEEQRETLRRRQEFLEQLTPEQRQRVRGFDRRC